MEILLILLGTAWLLAYAMGYCHGRADEVRRIRKRSLDQANEWLRSGLLK